MSKVLEVLVRDHINLSGLLDILERQIANFDQSRTIDLEVVELILGYAERYADQCHHPTEDLVYEALRERRAAIGEYVSGLQAVHANLSDLTRNLRSSVVDALRERKSADDDLVARANQFLETYRRHMELEDSLLFPAARDKLSDQDWEEIDTKAQVHAQHEFAKNVQGRFLALRDYIHTLERINLADSTSPSD